MKKKYIKCYVCDCSKPFDFFITCCNRAALKKDTGHRKILPSEKSEDQNDWRKYNQFQSVQIGDRQQNQVCPWNDSIIWCMIYAFRFYLHFPQSSCQQTIIMLCTLWTIAPVSRNFVSDRPIMPIMVLHFGWICDGAISQTFCPLFDNLIWIHKKNAGKWTENRQMKTNISFF